MKYEILDLPHPENCERCAPCLRIRLMEMGLITEERVEIEDKRLGLWIINILTDNENTSSRVALRQEELDRICLKGVL
jgi:Fe2+ transport system protein FeoA